MDQTGGRFDRLIGILLAAIVVVLCLSLMRTKRAPASKNANVSAPPSKSAAPPLGMAEAPCSRGMTGMIIKLRKQCENPRYPRKNLVPACLAESSSYFKKCGVPESGWARVTGRDL